MKKKLIVFLLVPVMIVLSAMFLFPTNLFATPIQWSGNGHYYEAIIFEQTDTKSWQEASDFAESKHGYLVTITSQDEAVFLNGFLPREQNYWIGAYQSGATTTSTGWYWVSGESWGHTNWLSGEPSDGDDVPNIEDGQEDYAYLFIATDINTYGWNDTWNNTELNGLIVEYNKNPKPSSKRLHLHVQVKTLKQIPDL